MAIFTRTNGDAKGVTNVDSAKGPGVIVATGLTKNPIAYKIVFPTSSAKDLRSETVTGGAVETVLRSIAIDSTVVMFQVENDANGQMSVLVEANGSGDSTIQARINALGNIGIAGNVWATTATVSSTGGFKLA
jgi:hypothetical protein